MKESVLRLTFTEGFEEGERICSPHGKVALGTSGEFGLRVGVKPPIKSGQYRDSPAEIEYLILSSYFAGRTFFPVDRWPFHVRVWLPLIDEPEIRDRFQKEDLYMIAFAMLVPDTSDELRSSE